MKRNDIQSRKGEQEEACARCFLKWYNKQHRAKYGLQRAEEAFHELANRTRWEFVAKQLEGDLDWLAIEVKGIVIPEARRQFMDWNKFLRQVSKDLGSRVKGSFLVFGVPAIALNQEERKQLREVIAQAISAAVPSMKSGDKVDLGRKILVQFPKWSFIAHLEMKPQPHIEHKMREFSRFTLFKKLDGGCSVELGMSPPHIFNVEGVEEEAICRLFNPTTKGNAKPNEQLRAAKEMGTKETILLLDCHLPYRPEIIKQALTNTGPNLLSSIDNIYLVSVLTKQITDVTPF